MTELRELKKLPFMKSDSARLKLRGEDRDRNIEDLAERLNEMVAFSYFDEDQIVGCIWFAQVNPNTCETWAILDTCAKHYVREIYHCARAILDEAQTTFRRIQAVVKADWPLAIRFVERLGFVREGRMRKFGPNGDDYYLYARVK